MAWQLSWVQTVYGRNMAKSQSNSEYLLNGWHCGVSLSKYWCRTWSRCMHMTVIRMWLSTELQAKKHTYEKHIGQASCFVQSGKNLRKGIKGWLLCIKALLQNDVITMTSLWHPYDITVTSLWHHYDIAMTSLTPPWHHWHLCRYDILTSRWHHYDTTMISLWHHATNTFIPEPERTASTPVLLGGCTAVLSSGAGGEWGRVWS